MKISDMNPTSYPSIYLDDIIINDTVQQRDK